MKLNKEYWENRYQNNDSPWDAGGITTPIKEYIDQLTDKDIHILIPGAGNSYEFDYLIKKGFKNTYVIDIAPSPIKELRNRNPELEEQIIEGDFFSLDQKFDLILEQTFFCALPPNLRNEYVAKMRESLNPKGKIVGLLFDFPLTSEGPPYGGSYEEYHQLFSKNFLIKKLETCYNSIKPRDQKEFFIHFEKK